MKFKTKTKALGGGYVSLSEGYGNTLMIGLMRSLTASTAYPFVALIYETDNIRVVEGREGKGDGQAPVKVCNCITASPRDNTTPYVVAVYELKTDKERMKVYNE